MLGWRMVKELIGEEWKGGSLRRWLVICPLEHEREPAVPRAGEEHFRTWGSGRKGLGESEGLKEASETGENVDYWPPSGPSHLLNVLPCRACSISPGWVSVDCLWSSHLVSLALGHTVRGGGYCSLAQLCLTLCNPMDCSTLGFPVLHHLPEFAQTQVRWVSDAIQPSHPLLSSSPPAQSSPASESFPMSRLFASEGQSIGTSASASVLPMNIQGWFPLRLTGLISLQSREFSKVFSSTAVRKHHLFHAQPSLWSNSHIHTWLL